MKKTLRRMRTRFLETMLVSAIGAAIIVAVLGMYSLVAYQDCFSTTSPNFIHLSEAAPILYKMILANVMILTVSLGLLYCVGNLKKRHH